MENQQKIPSPINLLKVGEPDIILTSQNRRSKINSDRSQNFMMKVKFRDEFENQIHIDKHTKAV